MTADLPRRGGHLRHVLVAACALGLVLVIAYATAGGPAEPVSGPPAASGSTPASPSLPSVTPSSIPTEIPVPPPVPIRLGVAVSPAQLRDRELTALFDEFGIDSLTAENAMKMRYLHPERGTYYWRDADAIVNYAVKNDLRVRGHTLVWHREVPQWVGRLPTRAQGRAALRDHITTVMRHYRGKVAQWDVVNEAYAEDGSLRDSVWRRVVGDDYVALAFRYAALADPTAELYYNDFGIESSEDDAGGNSRKTKAVLAMVRDLQRRDIRIDGVGLESHADDRYPGTGLGFEANMRRYAELGLNTEITELDIGNLGGGDRQARRYAELGSACQRVPTCTGVTTWGVHDGDTWRRGERPLLFDARYRPKPALAALRAATSR